MSFLGHNHALGSMDVHSNSFNVADLAQPVYL